MFKAVCDCCGKEGGLHHYMLRMEKIENPSISLPEYFRDADNPEDTSSYEVIMDKIQSLKDKKLKKFKELYFKCPSCKNFLSTRM